MKHWHKSAAYREALKTLLIPIFLGTEQAMECGSPSQHQATHDVDSNTVRLEQRREKRVQHGTQAQSRHAIAVNARGSASICSSVILRAFRIGRDLLKARPRQVLGPAASLSVR